MHTFLSFLYFEFKHLVIFFKRALRHHQASCEGLDDGDVIKSYKNNLYLLKLL